MSSGSLRMALAHSAVKRRLRRALSNLGGCNTVVTPLSGSA